MIGLLVENQFGVLARVAGVFCARALNIDSLSVAETVDPGISTMTIVTTGSPRMVAQVMKKLGRLINVVEVTALSERGRICRETVLIEITARGKAQEDVLRLTGTFGGSVIHLSEALCTVEITADEKRTNEFVTAVKSFGIARMVRGRIAMGRADGRRKMGKTRPNSTIASSLIGKVS